MITGLICCAFIKYFIGALKTPNKMSSNSTTLEERQTTPQLRSPKMNNAH